MSEEQQRTDEQVAADIESVRALRAENKSLRDRAKTAETNLEQATAQVDGFRRQALEQAAGKALRDPADFWTEGTSVAGFLNDEGAIDQDAVSAHLDQLISSKPHFAADPEPSKPPSQRPIESLRAGASPSHLEKPEPPKWSDVIRGRSDGF